MQMCRFRSKEDTEYKKLKGAVERFLRGRGDPRPSIPDSEASHQLSIPGMLREGSSQSSRRSSDIVIAPEGPVQNIVAGYDQRNFNFQ